MAESTTLTLNCPIRGKLKALKRSKDGLTPTEEYRRVQAIKYLLNKGYPKDNFKIEPVLKRFGSSGRNSFRSDFAVLDVVASTVSNADPDAILRHAVLLCEVKKDSANADYIKQTQVKPMLDFAKINICVGLYWSDIEQRIFWQEFKDKRKETREGPLSLLPAFGASATAKPLTFQDTEPSDSLLEKFSRIEDILHQASIDLDLRYQVMLQLLIAKIFDEHEHEGHPSEQLGIQDFSSIGASPTVALSQVNSILSRAISYYEKHLPKPIQKTILINPDVLVEALKILAPVRIIHSKIEVIQTFYMKFAKDLYRWDLAQYFTPTTLTAFIVDVLNLTFGEHIIDPACGSADFLIAAFHHGRSFDTKYADCVWGVDNSPNAVQIAVLNMLLNGDGKGNIIKDDSLLNIDKRQGKFDAVVCNPPFGTKITEKRIDVLSKFDLGHEWTEMDGTLQKTQKTAKAQETGILFLEACVRLAKPTGRIGIILPNGYLGNRSLRYRALRKWMLTHCKVACITSLPRFTFKSSGADVSACVVFLEKRNNPIDPEFQKENYFFSIEMIEKVGWEAGKKNSKPVFQRNAEDGSYIVDSNGELLLDCDFPDKLGRIRNSYAVDFFPWLGVAENQSSTEGWSVPISGVLEDKDLTLDPKRWCEKVSNLRKNIEKCNHFKLGDVLKFISEKTSVSGKAIKIKIAATYKYIELHDISYGEYRYEQMKGWQLPSRARHFAELGDLYIGAIWGSVQKWCLIGYDIHNVIVTNGCHRCIIKDGKESYLIDIVAFLCTEAYSVQMRAFARGSDGLAEVTQDDVANVLVPLIIDERVRQEIKNYVENLMKGVPSIQAGIRKLIDEKVWNPPEVEKRPSHIVLV